MISSPGVQISQTAVHLDALDRYRKTKVHFVDCLIAAAARAEDTPACGLKMHNARNNGALLDGSEVGAGDGRFVRGGGVSEAAGE